jgi:hypothetical protein
MAASQKHKTTSAGSVTGLLRGPSLGNRHVPDVQVRYSLTCTIKSHFDPLLMFSYSQVR